MEQDARISATKERIQRQRSLHYDDPLGFVNLPFDSTCHAAVASLVQKKNDYKPDLIVLIGIGGSSLGTLAVHEAINGLYYNERTKGPRFYCADAIDVDTNRALIAIAQDVLQKGQRVLLIIVSKSGTTTETCANAQLFFDLLRRYHPHDYADYVVAITDRDSLLWHQAGAVGCAVLEIPRNVGGRFSLFSAAGLFPLGMLGVNVAELCAGARSAVNDDQQSLQRAIWLYEGLQQSLWIDDLFIFDKAYAGMGAWYRQLVAESLGKRQDRALVPTVTMAVDLHSQVQLYFAGPRSRQTTFIYAEPLGDVELGGNDFFSGVREPSLAALHNSILQGVIAAYTKAEMRYTTTLIQKHERSLGYWLQSALLQVVYLGALMEVSVFDQPEVELYKKEIRALLRAVEMVDTHT